MSTRNILFLSAALFISSCSVAGQEHKMDGAASHADCPMMKKDAEHGKKTAAPSHHDQVMANGEKAMGFSQTATTHHFLIMDNGGAIQVEVNDAANKADRDKIRKHLEEIGRQFSDGVFTTPFAVHGQVPPGVPAMDEMKKDIEYTYEVTDNGARVRIATENPRALAAIHEFLRFQISDHKTGDPLTSEK
jgi:hypothetical protein